MAVSLNRRKRAALAVALHLLDNEERKRQRRIWVHEINLSRNTQGEFQNLYQCLRADEKRFLIYYRMRVQDFDELLQILGPDLEKQNTNWRESIEPAQRLTIALRYLATGDSFTTIGHSFRVGFSTVSSIVKQVCEAIWNKLQPTCLPEPTQEQWESNIRGFSHNWGFPNCCGCIDGKHVTIKCPKKSGSRYFCYLKKFSIVLMAIVDHDYKFTCIDVGAYGKDSDAGVFEASAMGQKFESGRMNIPNARPLPNQHENTPCVLLGDQAFALTHYLMRPYPFRATRGDDKKDQFNERLCSVRRLVENAFGHLTQRFRIFFRPIEVKVETAVKIVKAACVLHNFLRLRKSDDGFETGNEEEQRPIFADLPGNRVRAGNYAFEIRERFANYFSPTENNDEE